MTSNELLNAMQEIIEEYGDKPLTDLQLSQLEKVEALLISQREVVSQKITCLEGILRGQQLRHSYPTLKSVDKPHTRRQCRPKSKYLGANVCHSSDQKPSD